MQRASAVRAEISARVSRAPTLVLTRPMATRARVIRSLGNIGVASPNFVLHFTEPDRLGEHLANRYVMTIKKRAAVLALLHAVSGEPSRLRVEGARLQDRVGRSSSVTINGKSYLSGVEHGHVAMGTYTLDGEPVSSRVLRLIRAAAVDPSDTSALAKLVGFNVGLDAGTEGVPALINRSSGIAIEKGVIRSLDGLRPIASTQGGAIERTVVFELDRVFELLTQDAGILVGPVEKRLGAIKSGSATEILQNPADTQNLMFGGQERIFLEAVIQQVKSQKSEFAHLTSAFGRDIPEYAHHLMELAAVAREEWVEVMAATGDPEERV